MRNSLPARATAAILGLALSLNASSAAGTNLVVNGSFETGDFAGWSVVDSSSGTWVTTGDAAQAGRFGVMTGPFGTWGTLSQVLPTIPGRTYQLEYWLDSVTPGPNAFRATWDGQVAGNALVDVDPLGFRRFTVTGLLATSNATTLTFAFQHEPSFFYFDNVSVVAAGAEPPMADVAIHSATTRNSRQIDFSCTLVGASPGQVAVSAYRSADDRFDASDVLLGSITIDDVTATSGTISAPLVIDPTRPYVLVVADPGNSVAETSETNNTAVFRKLALGIITPGFQLIGNLPATGGLPVWAEEMSAALHARGYAKTLALDWAKASNTVAPGQTTVGANLLVGRIHAAVQAMTLSPTDVVDTHWIGHSRGAVVNGLALGMMAPALTGPMARGWIKMTMLDPHPARNGPTGPLCSFNSNNVLGWLLFLGCAAFEAIAQDPDARFPARVDQPEVFFQHTRYSDTPAHERLINLWGVADILPGSRDWTHPGIGHLEIPDAYRISEIEAFTATAAASTSPTGGARASGTVTSGQLEDFGLGESLMAKVSAARAALERGNPAAARGALRAFVQELTAQRGSHVPTATADLLIAAANSVLSSLK